MPSRPAGGHRYLSRILPRLGVDLRPGEGRLCGLLFALHFLILAFQYAAKSVRQASYVDSLGAAELPWVYLLIAVLSYPVLRVYGRLAERFDDRRLMAGSFLGAALSLVVFWGLFGLAGPAGRQPAWVSVAFYLWVSIFGILLVSQFWSYASQRLDPRQARRLFAWLGAGGILGSIAGGQIAHLASLFSTTRDALPAAAVLIAGSVFLLRPASAAPAGAAPSTSKVPAASLGQARDGAQVVRASPYLRLLAAILVLGAVVAQVIDLQFAWAVERSTASLDERTAVFGNLFSLMGVAALLFQLFLTPRIHRRLGVSFALRVLPATNGAATLVFVAAALFAPAFLLPAAWFLKIGENGLRYSLDQATRELLFQPVPAGDRPRAKAFLDVFVQRFAKGAAALLLLSVTFGWVSPVGASALSLAGVAVWIGLVGAVRRHYMSAFRDALLHRRLDVDDEIDLADAHTLEVVMEGLASPDAREVLSSLELLAARGRGRLVSPLLLHHDEPLVRRHVLQILCDAERRDAAPLVEKLLFDPDPEVRATATLALGDLIPHGVTQTMAERLRDADPRVRGVAVSFLVGRGEGELAARARTVLDEMLVDGDPHLRREAARALGGLAEPLYRSGLVQLLYDRDTGVVDGALEAVARRARAGCDHRLYVPILISHLRDRRLKHDARAALEACGESILPILQHFLADSQEDVWVRRALPKTMAAIGGRSAFLTLSESLAADDPFLRRKVIEALVSLRVREPDLRLDPRTVAEELEAESHAWLRGAVDLVSLGGAAFELRGPRVLWSVANGGAAHLLERLLADRMDDHLRNLFALLALVHPWRDIRAAHRGATSADPVRRAHALEYLDNLLTGESRRQMMAVLDDPPLSERLRAAQRLFGLTPLAPGEVLRRLGTILPLGDADAPWLAAAALHFIFDRRLRELYPVIREASAKVRAPLVQETTELLLSRLAEAS